MAERRVVIVTGTSSGIGGFLARHFLRQGDEVIGCSRRPAGWRTRRYRHYRVDITDEGQVKGFVQDVRRRHGSIDVLINNAGVASMNHTLLTPLASVRRVFETNFVGTFLLCREGARLMQRRGRGRIVNIGTVAVPLKLEGEAIYAASKSAVVTLTQILAKELAPFRITCNVVSPAPIRTRLTESVPPAAIEALLRRLPIKRWGRFEDVANVVDFFVRNESDGVTGQVICLGGVS